MPCMSQEHNPLSTKKPTLSIEFFFSNFERAYMGFSINSNNCFFEPTHTMFFNQDNDIKKFSIHNKISTISSLKWSILNHESPIPKSITLYN